jgi:hypothetical protein
MIKQIYGNFNVLVLIMFGYAYGKVTDVLKAGLHLSEYKICLRGNKSTVVFNTHPHTHTHTHNT